MKQDIAWAISDLDLASANLRVFTCYHHCLPDIPDGYNSTRQKTDWLVADELFEKYKGDEEFMEEYLENRDAVLAHHRAHEKARQGRGSWSSDIKKVFRQADFRRTLDTQ
jgi:hypothetical protein